jgi:hypothetical protein
MTNNEIQTRLDKLTDEQLTDLIDAGAIGERTRTLAEQTADRRGIKIS